MCDCEPKKDVVLEHDCTRHQEEKHREGNNYSSIKTRKKRTIYKCNTCQKTFKVKKLMTRHLETHVTRTEVKRSCTTCGTTFYFLGLLAQYHKSKAEGKQFKCTKCENNVNRSTHSCVHPEVKPEVHRFCVSCKTTFYFRGLLAEYHRTNTEGKEFKCAACKQWNGSSRRTTETLDALLEVDKSPGLQRLSGLHTLPEEDRSTDLGAYSGLDTVSETDRLSYVPGSLYDPAALYGPGPFHGSAALYGPGLQHSPGALYGPGPFHGPEDLSGPGPFHGSAAQYSPGLFYSPGGALYGPGHLYGPEDLYGAGHLYGPEDLYGAGHLYGPEDVYGAGHLYGPEDVYGPGHLYGPEDLSGLGPLYDPAALYGPDTLHGPAALCSPLHDLALSQACDPIPGAKTLYK